VTIQYLHAADDDVATSMFRAIYIYIYRDVILGLAMSQRDVFVVILFLHPNSFFN